MSYFSKASKLMRSTDSSVEALDQFMRSAIAGMSNAKLRGFDQRASAIDWGMDSDDFRLWLQRSLLAMPLPPEAVALWFCTPDMVNAPPRIYFVGCDEFDERPSHGDWASSVCWAQDEKGRAERGVEGDHPDEFVPRPLASLQSLLDEQLESKTRDWNEVSEFAFALTVLYSQQLIRRSVALLDHALLFADRDWIGVGFGPIDGDLYLCGARSPSGWVKASRKHRRVIKRPAPPAMHSDPELDLNSPSFNIHKYVDAGLDLNTKDHRGSTPLMRAFDILACYPRDWELVRRMLKSGADPRPQTSDGYHVLLSLMDGPLDIIEMALDMGADPDLQNVNGVSALNRCAVDARLDLLHILLRRGANPNLRQTRTLWTPLHSIAGETWRSQVPIPTQAEAIDCLIAAGANVNATDCRGDTPLLTALNWWVVHFPCTTKAERKRVAVALHLLDCGANPNCRINDSTCKHLPEGGTPLMCRQYGDGRLHMALLKHGADVFLTCKKGKTALDYAKAALAAPGKQDPVVIRKIVEAIQQRITATNAHRQ